MAKPYSMDLRERAMVRLAAGESTEAVAAALDISVSSVIKWARRQRQTGSVAPGKMGGHRPHRIAAGHETWLLQRVENDSGVTLRGLEEELRQRGLAIDHATVGRFLHRKGKRPMRATCLST
jgi:putative transposase